MKKLTLLLFFSFVIAFPGFAQNYEKCMLQGKVYFSKNEFLTTLERIDLAYEFAKSDAIKMTLGTGKTRDRTIKTLVKTIPYNIR